MADSTKYDLVIEMRNLEPEWPILTLGSVAYITGGVALGRHLSGSGTVELPYLRVANVQAGQIDTSDVKQVRVLRSEVRRYSLEAGDFVMTEGGDFDKLGRGAVWDGSIDPCLHQNHIFRVRADRKKILPKFLAIYSGTDQARKYFVSASKQTTNLATINLAQVRAFPLLVPPLPEQQRIIEVLDSVDESIRSVRSAIAKLRAMRAALLQAHLSEAARYSSKPLRGLAIGRGEYGSNSSAIPYDDHLLRYVRITDIDENGNLKSNTRMSIDAAASSPYLLRKNDLLLARTGFTTGKSYLYRQSDGPCVFAGYLVRFRIDPTIADPDYVLLWTQGERFLQWIGRTIREVGQRNISAVEYGDHHVSVPPLDMQRAVVGRIRAIDRRIAAEVLTLRKIEDIRLPLLGDLLGHGRASAMGRM